MDKNNIRDLFYKCIVPEAAMGKIKSFFYYSVAFGTKIKQLNLECKSKINISDVLTPTLVINDKDEFDHLLVEYVTKAAKFYGDSNFHKDVLNNSLFDKKDMICKEKDIIIHLFANATYEDFSIPIDFLKKRISFLDNFEYKKINIGYSSILDCDLN